MLLSDEVIQHIAQYHKLSEDDTEIFVEEVRATQAEILIKSFLVYYETHKTEAELRYLELLADGLNNDFAKYLIKFRDLFNAEATNNPDLVAFIAKRMATHIANLIYAFLEGKDRDTIEETLMMLFENADLAKIQTSLQ